MKSITLLLLSTILFFVALPKIEKVSYTTYYTGKCIGYFNEEKASPYIMLDGFSDKLKVSFSDLDKCKELISVNSSKEMKVYPVDLNYTLEYGLLKTIALILAISGLSLIVIDFIEFLYNIYLRRNTK